MITNDFLLIAGPCVVESEALCIQTADVLCSLAAKYDLPFVFKSSYRKDNRSRGDSFTGIGDRKALEILQRIKETYKIRVITDIHLPEEAFLAASYHIDILQIPAFLCRQTSLLKAAAKTGKCVNVKKGQFLAPGQMQFVVDKLLQFGCDRSKIFLTERGTQFGYSDLIFDVTHSLQQPNQSKGVAGGRPGMITTLATAGVSIGVDGLFIETHPRPEEALSDGANMLPLNKMEALLRHILPFRELYKKSIQK